VERPERLMGGRRKSVGRKSRRAEDTPSLNAIPRRFEPRRGYGLAHDATEYERAGFATIPNPWLTHAWLKSGALSRLDVACSSARRDFRPTGRSAAKPPFRPLPLTSWILDPGS